jgi:hypothetical protein
MTDELDDPFAPTELHVEGSLFSMEEMDAALACVSAGLLVLA